MGQRELLAALHREGDEQASAIRRTAEAEADRMRADAARRLDELRCGHEERRERLCTARQRDLLAEAEREASLVRLQVENELARGLRERSGKLLERQRDNDYAAFFKRLAAELPEAAWDTIRVNPADTALAAELFPTAAIEADRAISGGLEAVTSDGDLTVVNTLEARLERAWPELLPLMVNELRGRRP